MIKGGQWRQYTLSSFLGSTPGCLGAFVNVSLYVHGMIGFGAIVGGGSSNDSDFGRRGVCDARSIPGYSHNPFPVAIRIKNVKYQGLTPFNILP
jgi:hypothetical protein